jgi:predicted nuclease with TOPRIM domain
MSNNADELASLRARFVELKATLDRRIKENDESLRRLADLNHHIDQLLERSKRHSLCPSPKRNSLSSLSRKISYPNRLPLHAAKVCDL